MGFNWNKNDKLPISLSGLRIGATFDSPYLHKDSNKAEYSLVPITLSDNEENSTLFASHTPSTLRMRNLCEFVYC